MVQFLWKMFLYFFERLNSFTIWFINITPSEGELREMEVFVHVKIYMWMLIAALFLIVKKWKDRSPEDSVAAPRDCGQHQAEFPLKHFPCVSWRCSIRRTPLCPRLPGLESGSHLIAPKSSVILPFPVFPQLMLTPAWNAFLLLSSFSNLPTF